jgi:hypothetical protein
LGGPHVCGVVSDGTVRCWGSNSLAELGDGTTIDRHVPTIVPGLTNVLAVAAAEGHTCALRSGGEVFCWGDNKFGQVGNPDVAAPALSPAKVAGLSASNAIAARDFHSCSLGSDRSVQCWGFNASGQIGDPTTNTNPRPSPIVATRDALSIGAGAGKTCAILLDHAVYCWGDNLGNGTEASSTVPVRVPGISGAIAVAPGSGHTCTLLSDGTARCWGRNVFGEVGDGSIDVRTSPVAVKDLATPKPSPRGRSNRARLSPTARCRVGAKTESVVSVTARRSIVGRPRQSKAFPTRSTSKLHPVTPAPCWPTARCGVGGATSPDNSATARLPTTRCAPPFASREGTLGTSSKHHDRGHALRPAAGPPTGSKDRRRVLSLFLRKLINNDGAPGVNNRRGEVRSWRVFAIGVFALFGV